MSPKMKLIVAFVAGVAVGTYVLPRFVPGVAAKLSSK